ncbi:MAG: cobalamin-dependent protein [Planctomycetota bacterium]|nr:MAG: cobalamin-dependent protein [Planctomycetota bacterium]
MLDLLIIKPGAQKKLYQELSETLSGLEPPLWAALLGAFIRGKGYEVRIIDSEIESESVIAAVTESQARLVAVVVSGTNPSASTMNMVGARTILHEIKKAAPDITTILVGLHPSALPERTLTEEPVDMVCEGEGFSTLLDLLSGIDCSDIKGLWYKEDERFVCNPRAELFDPNDLPMPAWDLLPMDKYRAHNWHCFGHINDRTPYGVIYTSLGCPFNCSFCCINAIFGKHKIRYRAPKKVAEEIDYLVNKHGVKNLKIIDEMFDLNERHVIEFCELIIERKYDLNIWAYARVDTINEKKLEKMKQAGINWLGIGFESGVKKIRDKVSKGRFDDDRMLKAARMMQDAGVCTGGNFIFGLPDDDFDTMRGTLDMAKEINCEYGNFYVTMAYPGSKLYEEAVTNGTKLPDTWLGYSQYGYETQPLPTKHLSDTEILQFRDNAFNEYHGSERYQNMVLDKFGQETLQHIRDMLKRKLRRRLLGD